MTAKNIQIITTTPKAKEAEKIANLLVDKKLAACVQVIGPITSIYKWKGKKEKSKEYLCLIKATRNLYYKIEKEIKGIHPYETPEIIATRIIAGNKDYLNWIDSETLS